MRKLIEIFSGVLLFCSFAFAQHWQIIGPPGGRVSALAINPQNPDIIYAGTRDGSIFRSTNKGKNSELITGVSGGIIMLNVSQIAINPQNPSIIYTSIYRSTDGGRTWSKMNGDGTRYAINPLNPKVVFATRSNEIWITKDGGDSWVRLFSFVYNTGAITVSPSDTNTLYIAADGAVHKSTNSGMNWVKITTALGNIEPLSIAINPHDANIIYIGTKNEGIFKTTDGGTTWRLILSSAWVNDIAINSTDTSVAYAVTGDYLSGYVGHVYKTTNGGQSWVPIDTGLPSPQNRYLYTIAINPQQPEELYIGTYGWGVYKTTNGGSNWEWTNLTTTPVLNIYVDPDSSGHIYAGTADEGILMTPDEGVTWRALDFGVPQTVQRFFRQFTFDPNNRKIAYTTGGSYGLFKSTDGDNTWTLTSLRGNFDTWIWVVNVHPKSSDTVYVGETGWLHRDLYRSTDGGTTWQNLHLINSESSIEAIMFDPTNHQMIYVTAGEKGIFKTIDGGIKWQTINNGLRKTDPPLYAQVLSLIIRRDSTNILYAAQRAVGTTKGGISVSKNGGIQWSSIDSTLELLNPSLSARDIITSPVDQRRIYVSLGPHGQPGADSFSRGGLFLTTNCGKTWTHLFDDAFDGGSYSLAGDITVNPCNPKEIYISSTYGIVKLIDTSITSVEGGDLNQPLEYKVYQSYPNPFNASTRIEYHTPQQTMVKLKIYDIFGRVVATLVNDEKRPGIYEITWYGKDAVGNEVPSGIYFYRLETQRFKQTKKMLLLR